MDRTMIEEHLEKAESHVLQAEDLVARQSRMVEELIIAGLDASHAKKLLQSFKDTLELHVADRERLRAELAGVE